MVFKLVISEKESTNQIEIDDKEAKSLIGLKIGNEFDGNIINHDEYNLDGLKLKITGGSDKNGFPMKRDLPGNRRIKSLVSGGIGYKPAKKGEKRRKSIRGNVISDDIVQINTIVLDSSTKSLADVFVKEEESE